MTEQELEQALIGRLTDLQYTHRPDIRNRAALEDNFRNHFEALNRVELKPLTDEQVRDAGHYQRAVEYIHQNPVKAKLCQTAKAWP